jgi:Tfp pilus assembly protein PilN
MAGRLEIGLDVAPHEVRIARAERTLGGLRPLGVERRALPNGDADVDASLAALATERPAAVHLALPAHDATHRIVDLPFTDRARLAEVAPLELLGRLPSAPEGTTVASTRLDADGGRGRVLAAAVRAADLDAARARLAQHGLPVGRIELAPLPVWALVPAPLADATVVIADGARSAVTCRRAGRLVGLRALDAADPAALAAELGWTLPALDAPLPLLVTGADAAPLLRALTAAGTAARPLAGEIDSTPGDDAFDAGAGALGLVSRAAPELRLALAGTPTAAPGDSRRLRRLAIAAMLLAVLDLGLVHLDLARREAALAREADAVAAAALPDVPPAEARARLVEAADLRRRVGSPSQSVLEVLRDLSSRVPAALPLDLDEVGIDAETVRIHGRCGAFDAVDALRRALATSPFAREVVAEETRSTVDGAGVEFRLRIERSAGGAPS